MSLVSAHMHVVERETERLFIDWLEFRVRAPGASAAQRVVYTCGGAGLATDEFPFWDFAKLANSIVVDSVPSDELYAVTSKRGRYGGRLWALPLGVAVAVLDAVCTAAGVIRHDSYCLGNGRVLVWDEGHNVFRAE